MNFRDFLEKKSFTQEEFANKIGTSSRSIGNWVNNSFKPSKMMQKKMAEVLNMDIEEVTSMFINNNSNKPKKVEPKAPKIATKINNNNSSSNENDVSGGLTADDWDNI